MIKVTRAPATYVRAPQGAVFIRLPLYEQFFNIYNYIFVLTLLSFGFLYLEKAGVRLPKNRISRIPENVREGGQCRGLGTSRGGTYREIKKMNEEKRGCFSWRVFVSKQNKKKRRGRKLSSKGKGIEIEGLRRKEGEEI